MTQITETDFTGDQVREFCKQITLILLHKSITYTWVLEEEFSCNSTLNDWIDLSNSTLNDWIDMSSSQQNIKDYIVYRRKESS